MKFDKKLAAILVVCLAALLIMIYIASQKGQAQNNAIINEGQVQHNTTNQTQNGTTATGQNTGMANPASVFCMQHGGMIRIVTAPDGSQSGLCVFPDGSQCDEWAYYRGECPSSNQTPSGNITGGGTSQAYGGYVPSLAINETLNGNLSNQTNLTCSDTESSGDYFSIAGTTTGSFNGIEGAYSDYCLGNVLHYYMCEYVSAGPVIKGTYACPFGCLNGACVIPSNTTICADSDGGANPYLQGTTTSSGNIGTDYCINGSGQSVMEYYCLNDMINSMEYNCPYGCSGGECANNGASIGLEESDFMIMDDSMPNLLSNQPLIEPPPQNGS